MFLTSAHESIRRSWWCASGWHMQTPWCSGLKCLLLLSAPPLPAAHEPNSLEALRQSCLKRVINIETLHSWLTQSRSGFRSGSVPSPMLRCDEWRWPQQWLQLPEAWSPQSPTQTWLCYKHKTHFIFLNQWVMTLSKVKCVIHAPANILNRFTFPEGNVSTKHTADGRELWGVSKEFRR